MAQPEDSQLSEYFRHWEENDAPLADFDISFKTVFTVCGANEVVIKRVKRMRLKTENLAMRDFVSPDGREHRIVRNERYHFHAQRDEPTEEYYLLDGSYLAGLNTAESERFKEFRRELQLDASFFGLLREVLQDREHFNVHLDAETVETCDFTISCVSTTKEANEGDVLKVSISNAEPHCILAHELHSRNGLITTTKCSLAIETPVGFASPVSISKTYQNGKLVEEMEWELISANRCNTEDAEFYLEYYQLTEDSLASPASGLSPLAIGAFSVVLLVLGASLVVRRMRG